ncbi:hypothetical protein ACFS32_02700 [Novosphingobium pokkalii]|uniref:hypothetical protein n=1 Tax=Novosphingobium pokkalii TaxID=1770194 RepID=UPI00363186F8
MIRSVCPAAPRAAVSRRLPAHIALSQSPASGAGMTGAKPLSLDWRIARRLVATFALTALAAQAPVRADTPSTADQALAVHGQYTLVAQGWAASPRPMPATTASRRARSRPPTMPRSIWACAPGAVPKSG